MSWSLRGCQQGQAPRRTPSAPFGGLRDAAPQVPRILYPPGHRQHSATAEAVKSAGPQLHTLGGSPQLVQHCSVENWNSPLSCDASDGERPGEIVVALGKFDAMHIGHRSLAVKASAGDCQPVLLSFSGIAEVLGLPVRLPLVAAADRPRVLASWAEHCDGRQPRQRMVPFHEIRTMSPEQFVSVLARELGASGVVAGRNYRFGYKAAGDARALQELGAKHGLRVHIVDLVSSDRCPEDGHAPMQVSSSQIRELLSQRQVKAVQRLLGRQYRLVASLPCDTAPASPQVPIAFCDGHAPLIPAQCFLNMPPAPGRYEATITLAYRGAGRARPAGSPAPAESNGQYSPQGDLSLQTGSVQECQRGLCEVTTEGLQLIGAGLDLQLRIQELLEHQDTHAAYLVVDFDDVSY